MARNEPSLCRVTAGPLVLVVLVGDVADDELDQIFDRDQSVAAAVFVDDQREMNARRLHLGEQIERRHRRRRVEDFANDLGRRQRHRKIDIREIEIGRLRLLRAGRHAGSVRGARRHERDQIADMDHAGRIVERVVVDHEPRMPGALEHFDQFAERDVLLHGDDVGARHHDALDPGFAQPEDILEHGRFFGRKARLRLLGGENEFEIGAGRGRLPAEQDAHDARQPAFRLARRLRHDHRQTAMLAARPVRCAVGIAPSV